MAFVNLSHASVAYKIYSARGRSLKHQLFRTVGGMITINDDSRVVVNALSDVTLLLNPGDKVALIGGNGAGKSTLLKVVAGILEPSSGLVQRSGRISSLLDMSMGMDPEATGYENIILRSVFLGASFREAKQRVAEIEAFSELGDYLGFPMRTYSAGMSLRLSFAIATSMQPEVLVLDEMISAGDAGFAAKAKARMDEIINKLQILVIATHDGQIARNLCNRGLVLHQGKIIVDGPIGEALDAYAAMGAAPPNSSKPGDVAE